MNMANVVILFKNMANGDSVDLQVPTDISADEFVRAVRQVYKLDIDLNDPMQMYLQMEDPIAFLQGDERLADLGMRMGSVVYYYKR